MLPGSTAAIASLADHSQVTLTPGRALRMPSAAIGAEAKHDDSLFGKQERLRGRSLVQNRLVL